MELPILAMLALIGAFSLSLCFLLLFKGKMPQDKGRAYAVNAEQALGKAKGTGLLFIPVFVLVSLLLMPFSWEFFGYMLLVLVAMVFGYLDDRSSLPWGGLKKGLLDLGQCLLALVLYMLSGDAVYGISLFGWVIPLPVWLFVPMALFVLWAFINCCNCSDGVDGLFGSLASICLCGLGYSLYRFGGKADWLIPTLSLLGCLFAYLTLNAKPNILMMGDAGSRAIGLFLGIMVLKTGNMLLCLPFALVILLNGGLGLVKLSVRRAFKKMDFMDKLRTPLHDEARKHRGWSDTQTVFRFCIVQLLLCLLGVLGQAL